MSEDKTQSTNSVATETKDTNKTTTTTKREGGGWRQMQSTSAFRAINFELYVKPNTRVSILGGLMFFGCLGYIVYMNISDKDKGNTYTAINEDGSLTRRVRTSKWD
ncbi:hypothetical protein FSP39_007263 [Pinctada imbricata]|uniref:Small integral membrane protein 8 n=1 Tax=Pinctada imbricata TaxID=66713 RepID=A0AA88Y8F9_PINIB|nr:hypothetical protein FSP39_007263 [Pinctada imbricata]